MIAISRVRKNEHWPRHQLSALLAGWRGLYVWDDDFEKPAIMVDSDQLWVSNTNVALLAISQLLT